MKPIINNKNTEVILSFTPAEYFLCYGKDDRFGDKTDDKVWTLNPRIDMSYKGKDDQVAMPIIYLSDQEAETFKKAGFTQIE